MYDTKLNQTYKFDCLEQMLRINSDDKSGTNQ